MTEIKKGTATINGRLWGARAREWAALQEGQVRPVYEAVLERAGVQRGSEYLDAGCGAGMAAQMAAARGARVHGLDASEELLAVARERTPTGDFRVGDLEELPFENASFDVVTGFNSFQYAAHAVAALGQARRVARPTATVAIVTWGTPEGMDAAALVGAIKTLLPPPPPGAPGPFALSEETALRKFATDAGLRAMEVFDVESPFEYPDLATAIRGLNSSGVAVRAIEHAGEEAVSRAHEDVLARFKGPGGYRIGARFRCLLARV